MRSLRYDANRAPVAAAWLEQPESARIASVVDFHRADRADHPPVGDPALHAVYHCVVETQIALNDPPETAQAMKRLRADGLDRHESLHAIASVILRELHDAHGRHFDAEAFRRGLDALSASSWRETAENLPTLDEASALLIGAGPRMAPDIEARILMLGKAAIPALVGIASDRGLLLETSPGEGWAPIHAARLLGALRAEEAVGPLVELLTETNADEYAFSAAIAGLRGIGEAALNSVLQADDSRKPEEAREGLLEVLSGLGILDDRIYERLIALFARNAALGACLLAEYGDSRAVPILSEFLDRRTVEPSLVGDPAVNEVVEAIEHLGGVLTLSQRAKLDESMSGPTAFRAAFESRIPAQRVERPGRNEPCHCGSSKKYKKCHLREDESAA